ncbi:MAG: PEP-CTERM sorting domain-containing protein, partial [Terriglobia bacterium]
VLDPMGGNAIANLNTLENGGYLEVDSGVTFNSANNFTDGSPTDSGNNTLRADGGTVNIGSPTTSASLNVNSSFLGAVFGGVVNVYGNLTNTDGAVETGTGFGTDPGGNVLNVTGNYVNTTSGSGPSGATLLLDTKNDSVTVGGNFSNNGTVSVGSCDLSTGACSSGMSLTVHGSAGFTQTAGDTIVGGTLTAPTVNINGGQLMGTGTIVGNVTNGGTAAGGIIPTLFYGSTTAPGTLSITGNYTQTSGGTLDELISGTAAGQFSVINATGSMTLGGALDVSTLNGFTFANGQSFDILNFTGRSGEFGTFTYGSYSGSGSSPLDIGGGLELELAYNNNDVLLNVGQMNTSNTDNWIDTTDNWNNSANYAADWSTGAIPTSTQDVVVGTGAGGTVTYNDANDTVSSLTVQKGTSSNYTLAFDASDKLTVTNAVNINAGGEIAVAVSGASLSASSLANNAGTLKVANGGSVSTTGGLSNANAGTVTVAGALSSISVGGTLTNDSTSTVQVQNGGALSAGSVTNSGSVFTGNATGDTGNNTLTVTGAFTNNSGGSVSLMANKDSATAGSFSNAGTVSLAAGTTLAVNGSSGYTQSGGTTKVNGTLTANQYTQSGGTTTVAAGGTLTASTQYSQSSGTTDVDGTLITPTFSLTGGLLTGTGKVQGNVSNTGGMLDPGDEPGAGTFSVTGNYAQGSGGTIMADINGGAPGSFDVLDVGALASLNGTLDISLNNGFMPVNNEQFVILDAMGGLNGTFSTIMGQDFGPGNADSWNISYLNNKVTLTANIGKTSPTPEPASLMLFGTGLLGLAWVTRRRMRAGA